MPLDSRHSKKALKKNVATLIREGKPPAQAVAIAHNVTGMAQGGELRTAVEDKGDHWVISGKGAPWKVAKKGLHPDMARHIQKMAAGGVVKKMDDGGKVGPQGWEGPAPQEMKPDPELTASEKASLTEQWKSEPSLQVDSLENYLKMAAPVLQAQRDLEAKIAAENAAQPVAPAQQQPVVMPAETPLTAQTAPPPTAIVVAPRRARSARPVRRAEGGDVDSPNWQVLEEHADHYVVTDGAAPFKVARKGLGADTLAKIARMARRDGAVVHAADGVPPDVAQLLEDPNGQSMAPTAEEEPSFAEDIKNQLIEQNPIANVYRSISNSLSPSQAVPAPVRNVAQSVSSSAANAAGTAGDYLGINPTKSQEEIRAAQAADTGARAATATGSPSVVISPPSGAKLATAAAAENPAPRHPSAPAPAPSSFEPGMVPTVDEVRQVADVAKAALDEKAKIEAQRAAQAAHDAQEQQDVLKQSVADRAAFTRDWNARADAYEQQILSTQIDPHHFFASRSTGANVMSSIGIMLGAMGSGLTGGPNLALEQLNKNIDRDIDAQKANLGKVQSLYSMNLGRFRDAEQAYSQTQSDLLSIAKGQATLTAAQFGGPEAIANANMLKAQIDQQLLQTREKMADDWQKRRLQDGQIRLMDAKAARASGVVAPADPQAQYAAKIRQYAINKGLEINQFIDQHTTAGVASGGFFSESTRLNNMLDELSDKLSSAGQALGIGRHQQAQLDKSINAVRGAGLASKKKEALRGLVNRINSMVEQNAIRPPKSAKGTSAANIDLEGE